MFFGLFAGIGLFILCMVYARMLTGSSSHRYRKHLCNLYVVGKIRKLADADNINLKQEEKEFHKSLKEIKKYDKDLDAAIEFELMEKVCMENKEVKEE